MEIFGETILNILLYDYFTDIVKSIVVTYRIIIILLEDFPL